MIADWFVDIWMCALVDIQHGISLDPVCSILPRILTLYKKLSC